MRHLVIGTSFLQEPSWRIMVDEALSSLAEGNEVFFAYCDGACRVCCNNPLGSRLACLVCRFYQRRYLKKLLRGVKLLPLKHQGRGVVAQFQYNSLSDIKGIDYHGINIGYGVLSSYISWTRELIEVFTARKHAYMDFLLSEAVRMADLAAATVESVNPDCLSLYNGRMLEARPFLDLARIGSIEMRSNEIVLVQGLSGEQIYRRIVYPNCLPHDVDENERIAECLWAQEGVGLNEKRRVARRFYEKRRGGVPAGDAWNPGQQRTFIQGQKTGQMPEDWNPKKKNIAIFNSSEDEYSSIDPKFDSFSLFRSQLEGVSKICELLANRPDYHVYLRVHPNLGKLKFTYHTDLYELPKRYSNLTVLPATSNHSTYDLMQAADKVVVFGSTMGAEAAYWGKSVILLGASLYYRLGFCHTPRTEGELLQDLTGPSFACPQNENILKYGYYLVSREAYSTPTKFLTVAFRKIRFLRKIYWVPTYPRILWSWMATKAVRSKTINYILESIGMSRMPVRLYHD